MQCDDKAWIEYREKFSELYDNSNYSSPLQSLVMRSSHKLVEKAYSEQMHFGHVLEVGAGTGEHLPFVRHTFDKYILADLDHKTLEVAKIKLAETYGWRVGFEAQTGDSLAYADNTFDRLVTTHVLEHIYHLIWC